MNWTSPLVRDYIKDTFEVTYSDRGTRGLLYRLGFSCTRPTYTLAKADPAKQAAFRADFEVVKQQLIDGHIDRILFEDESMIRDYQAIGRTWFPKGQQKQIPTYGKHWGDKLLGQSQKAGSPSSASFQKDTFSCTSSEPCAYR